MAEADVIRALQDKQVELTTGINRLGAMREFG